MEVKFMAEKKELHVDFEVVEEPFQADFPRQPNVISRMGHEVKIIAHVREVQDGTKSLEIGAKVYRLGPRLVGPGSHQSRIKEQWGQAKIEAFNIPASLPPYEFPITVSPPTKDEHLGQGPDYTAEITIHENVPGVVDNKTGDADTSGRGREGEGAASENKFAESGTKFELNFVAM
jgi:hypothetical protein